MMGYRAEGKGEIPPLSTGCQRKTRRVFLETKILSQMASGGGKNTKFFQNSVVHNRLGSKIHKIKKADGSQVETIREVGEELTSYFKGIMTKDNNDRD